MTQKVYIRSGVDPKIVSNLPKMPVDQWRKLASEKPRLITDKTAAAAGAAHSDAAKGNLVTLARLYKARPDILPRFSIDKNGHIGSANSAPTISFIGADHKPHSVRTINRDAMAHDALVARAQLSSRTNQAAVYARALEALQRRAKNNATLAQAISGLPASYAVDTSTVKDINQGIAQLADIARQFITSREEVPSFRPIGTLPSTPPPPRPSCGQEEGTGNGGDSTSCDPNAPLSANGLLKNKNWPLKYYTTCIRQQGKRGTCPAFSTIAAMEALIAVKFNRWVNLSEQDLYKHMRYEWFPFDDYSDGFAPPVSLLFQLFTGYLFAWEREWNYNPSWQRVDDKPNRRYTHSCDNYQDPNCSNTNHQSHQICWQFDKEVPKEITKTVSTWVEDVVTVVEDVVNWLGSITGTSSHTEIWGHWVEKTVTEVVTEIVSTSICFYDTMIVGTSGFGISSPPIVFWDPLTDGQQAINIAKTFVSGMVPVIYCFYAMPSFHDAINHGGYVIYADQNEAPGTDDQGHPKQLSDTGHCVCITGFMDNADLPSGAPPGSGGGYFIVKNSWGTTFGDCGYAYVPYDWVIRWGNAMCTINSIMP